MPGICAVPELYAKVLRPFDDSINHCLIHFTSVSASALGWVTSNQQPVISGQHLAWAVSDPWLLVNAH
jgi:hypothetical protein